MPRNGFFSASGTAIQSISRRTKSSVSLALMRAAEDDGAGMLVERLRQRIAVARPAHVERHAALASSAWPMPPGRRVLLVQHDQARPVMAHVRVLVAKSCSIKRQLAHDWHARTHASLPRREGGMSGSTQSPPRDSRSPHAIALPRSGSSRCALRSARLMPLRGRGRPIRSAASRAAAAGRARRSAGWRSPAPPRGGLPAGRDSRPRATRSAERTMRRG